MLRATIIACTLGLAAASCGRGGDAVLQAAEGQKATSPSGRYVLTVTAPDPTDHHLLSFRIDDARGTARYEPAERWADRHRLYFVWDDADRLWSYSSDVGTDVWEHQPDGAWTSRPWIDTDLAAPASIAKYLPERRPRGARHP
jgi:hypothetical protein